MWKSNALSLFFLWVFVIMGVSLGTVFIVFDIYNAVEKDAPHEVALNYPKGPAFVYCVEGETALVFAHTIGPITFLDQGYLLFRTKDAIIRVDGSKCVLEWRK